MCFLYNHHWLERLYFQSPQAFFYLLCTASINYSDNFRGASSCMVSLEWFTSPCFSRQLSLKWQCRGWGWETEVHRGHLWLVACLFPSINDTLGRRVLDHHGYCQRECEIRLWGRSILSLEPRELMACYCLRFGATVIISSLQRSTEEFTTHIPISL